ncbi:glycosyltransferase [Lentzea nigeriaca]|uniref:glycosyltransferase n=1 Tax=Lentzea nigeriaca TaxID=1128665 RepID=UPI0027DD88F6|nr:glycosyltransferase [Lentzea nigeriaca]
MDVVIPCYNYAHFLPACVRSVLDQPGVDVRVLVIDDTSSDDTPAVMAELTAADKRVEGRRHEVNKGHIATYNEGLLEWASADYTVLLSADDLLAPGALQRAAAIFEQNPDVGMVYGRVVYYSDHDALPKVTQLPTTSKVWRGEEWIENRFRSSRNVISSPEVVVRTRIQQKVGGYRADLPHAGDLEMWLRIAAVSDIGYVSGKPAAYYRVHENSMMRTTFKSVFADLEQRRDVFDLVLEQNPGLPARLKPLARKAIAGDALWRAVRLHDRDQLDGTEKELLDFARETYPALEELPEYKALLRRRKFSPAFLSRTQLFLAPHAYKRAKLWVGTQRWKWRGEW